MHADGNVEGCAAGALAIAGLQHEESAVLHRELAVLHVLQVRLEARGCAVQLLEALGERFGHLPDWPRRSESCMPLRVTSYITPSLHDCRGYVRLCP